jgi:arginase family enzyme
MYWERWRSCCGPSRGRKIVGCDVVELSPELNTGGAHLAAASVSMLAGARSFRQLGASGTN